MRRSIIAVAIFLIPLTTQAQVRGGGGGARGGGGHAMISAPRSAAPSFSRAGGGVPAYSSASARSLSMAGMQRSPVYRGTRLTSSRPNNPRGYVPDFTGVPGLGFDWVHYAATHPGNGRNGRGNHGNFGNRFQGYFPFFDSGFLLPYADSYDYADGPAQTAAYYDEGPAPPDAGSGYVEQADPRPYATSRPVNAYDVVVKPPNPNDAYIFVKRDGSVFFAVAYSWDAGSLSYITQEGVRRSVSRDDLDLHATQQFNEQRGYSFRLPAA